jgi:hypothetical protein
MIKILIIIIIFSFAIQEHRIQQTKNIIKIFENYGYSLANSKILEKIFTKSKLELWKIEEEIYIRENGMSKKLNDYMKEHMISYNNGYNNNVYINDANQVTLITFGNALSNFNNIQKEKGGNCGLEYSVQESPSCWQKNILISFNERIKILEEEIKTLKASNHDTNKKETKPKTKVEQTKTKVEQNKIPEKIKDSKLIKNNENDPKTLADLFEKLKIKLYLDACSIPDKNYLLRGDKCKTLFKNIESNWGVTIENIIYLNEKDISLYFQRFDDRLKIRNYVSTQRLINKIRNKK